MTVVHSLSHKLLAEFVGTLFLLIAGVGVAATGGGDIVAVAFAHGLAIAIGVTAVGHVSGGHLNPAVTAAMIVFKKINPLEGLFYILAQLGGAVVGALLMVWGFDQDMDSLSGVTPALAEGLSVGNGILLEAVGTFMLIWVVFAVAVDRDGAWFKVAGLPIGFAVTTGIFTIGAATGAALNPARWFAPALLSGTWDNALVWIVGPVVGGIVAGAAYLYGIQPRLAGPAAEKP